MIQKKIIYIVCNQQDCYGDPVNRKLATEDWADTHKIIIRCAQSWPGGTDVLWITCLCKREMIIWPASTDLVQKLTCIRWYGHVAGMVYKSLTYPLQCTHVQVGLSKVLYKYIYIHIRPISMRAVLLIQLNNSQVKCVIPYLLVADSCHLPEVCRMLRKLKRGRKGKKRTSSKKGGGGTLQEMGKERISFLVLASHGPS